MTPFFSTLLHRLSEIDWFRPNSRLHWIYLASSLVIAVLIYLWRRPTLRQSSPREFLFPQSVLLHSSARTDYLYVAITMPLWLIVLAPHFLSTLTVARETAVLITQWLGAWESRTEPALGITVAYTVAVFLAGDFARYWAHRWMHTSRLLWEFHKVHHSAEVLTPITLFRMHVVEQGFTAVIAALVAGVATGAFIYLFPEQLSPLTILSVNAGKFIFNLIGVHLRHSHIWWSFGRRVEHFVVSPAQHQIHHSDNPKHFDRNFGFELAIWDWMFGSLYVTSAQPEKLRFGLGDEENRRLATFMQLQVRPFVAAAELLFDRRQRQES